VLVFGKMDEQWIGDIALASVWPDPVVATAASATARLRSSAFMSRSALSGSSFVAVAPRERVPCECSVSQVFAAVRVPLAQRTHRVGGRATPKEEPILGRSFGGSGRTVSFPGSRRPLPSDLGRHRGAWARAGFNFSWFRNPHAPNIHCVHRNNAHCRPVADALASVDAQPYSAVGSERFSSNRAATFRLRRSDARARSRLLNRARRQSRCHRATFDARSRREVFNS
jgi:hypothetical protein